MTNPYTFNELKTLNLGDVFWTRNEEFTVISPPILTENTFYGETYEKVEFDGLGKLHNRKVHFVLADDSVPFGDDTYNLYKTPTSHNIEGFSPLKPREDTETFGIITKEE